ncbi:MAG: DEAD/DEAH box helicase [Candidatus Heimdallarchaeota archaeon]|nr:DEAD/DEAH box helicase [Candidatus Heimdallarchaeota archaeon]
MMKLNQEYDTLSKRNIIKKDIPEYIQDNLNPNFELREYQIEAIARFIYYLEEELNKAIPFHLLFHMATGSGKTLIMAANILYLYNKGYRNFLFFVNNTNIIEKTRENFLNPNSSKYLFAQKIKLGDKEVKINEVDTFEVSYEEDINIVFTTIQGLHSYMNTPRENTITYEDFKDRKLVILSDEAHHINAWTRSRLNKTEEIGKNTWEYTVNNIFRSNPENIMLEYTATIDIDNQAIYEKYKDKIIFEYSLKQFRLDGYSKEIKVLQADLDNIDRMLQAMLLSQYRRKVAERNGLHLKPVILFKSKYIKDSEENEEEFRKKMQNLTVEDIQKIKAQAEGNILEKAFDFFEEQNITFSNLITELKEDFSKEKCILLDSQNIEEEDQLKLNSLEDRNNEIRAIFAVDMLNEGWDVLNLFDIVRLYETRDGRWLRDGTYRPGSTTLSEVQLIGRGARYYPFEWGEDGNKFTRKFDQDLDSDLKIIEELYYHSSHKPRYIQELKTTLRESGIMPPQEPKTIHLKVKEEIKSTPFWNNGFIFVNKKVETNRSKIKDLNDLNISKNFGPVNLRTGFTRDRIIFDEEIKVEQNKVTKGFELKDFNETIIRKATTRLNFYKFNNLKKYFPKLKSMNEFIESLKDVKVDIRSSTQRLNNLTPDDKLDVCLRVLQQIKGEIKTGYTDYEGTKLFIPQKVKEIVKDKKMRINVSNDSEQEYGVAMREAIHENLRLNLSNKNWYVYDENYGTDQEKHFIQFINGIMKKLEEKYEEIYLVRNANLFKIYRFSDGQAIEPDFVVFLKEKDKKELIQYQLYVEPKGPRNLEPDKWKEEFLKEIEDNYKIEILADNEEFRLFGMPFYNYNTRDKFESEFNEKLGLIDS